MRRLDRDGILAAITDWVDEHGSVPSRSAFLRRYDLPRAVFQGGDFRTWSDAVVEAGFEPNEATARLDVDDVYAAVTALSRRLGRIPTVGEFRYEKRLDPTFPRRDVIVKRLGGTNAERAGALRTWCESHPEDADILAMLPAIGPEESPAGDAARDGSVYMLKSGRFYKVGMTYSVPRRWAEIAGAAAEEVELVHHFKTDDPAGIEAYWHRRFAGHRQGGEWFALKPADVAAFKRRTKFM